MHNVKAVRWRPVVLEACFELLLVIIFLKLYNVTRNLFGSQACSPATALAHAEQVIWAERILGIYWEEQVQSAMLWSLPWIRFWNVFYGSAHMAVTVFCLAFLFALRPVAYQRCRTTFMLMNASAIFFYAVYPLMPPRLVNSCDAFGGCQKGYGYVDTLHVYGGFWSWKSKGIAKVTNHYAAMPSMHFGYSLWSSLSIYEHSPYAPLRVLAVVYPILTLYCITVTANHFFLDAVCGAFLYYLALKCTPYLPKIGRGAQGEKAGAEEGGGGEGGGRLKV